MAQWDGVGKGAQRQCQTNPLCQCAFAHPTSHRNRSKSALGSRQATRPRTDDSHKITQGGLPMKDDMPLTRRGALKAGATLAAGVAASGGLSAAGSAEKLRPFQRAAAVDLK